MSVRSPTPSNCEMIENLPFTTGAGLGERARIGLVVLASDYTVEHEIRHLVDVPGVACFHARIRMSPSVTPQTLAAMGPEITETVERILPGDHLDVVAYGCTSASTVLGVDAVSEKIHAARPDAKATNPMSAAFAAFEALGARRIAVLTPYRRDVNEIVRACIEGGGYEVPVFGSFNEEMDPVVAAIDENSLREAVISISTGRDVDAVFVSCTSVRIAAIVPALEAELGIPVTSSNHAMAWHCLRLAGVDDRLPERGRLYAL